MAYLLPQSFDEINDTLKEKIKSTYNISDSEYQGSNIGILANIFSYAIAMVNTNMNFGINETMIARANAKKNIITLARELGYEPQRKKSFKYKIRLKAKKTGVISIPRFSKFSDGTNSFIYLDNDKENKFGESSNVLIKDQKKFDEILIRKGNTAGSILVTEDDELVEVLEKTNSSVKKLLLNNLSGTNEPLSLYSKTYTSLFSYNINDNTYNKLAEIEAMVVNEEDNQDTELIIQLKNIDYTNMPLTKDDALTIKFFTDDIGFNYLPNFAGFVCSDYNPDSEVIKFKLKDNNYIINNEEVTIDKLITLYRKKRISIIDYKNPDGNYLPENLVCILQEVNSIRETTIEVTQGELLSYEDLPELKIVIDKETEDTGYVVLDQTDIEQNGIFLEISRVNYNNELILKQTFTQRNTHLAPKVFKGEDTSFIVLQDYFDNYNEYLKIYTQYASTGTKFYQGNIFYFKLLKSLGSKGSAKGLMTSVDLQDDFEIIPYETNPNNINDTIDNFLVSTGSDEESIEEIRKNAPLYHNLAHRLVTKHDYKTFCSSTFAFVEQAQVWGGEELDEVKRLGHVFFSFIPKSRTTEFTADENKQHFTLNNFGNRDVFFLPENQILLKEDGGADNSVFETMSKNKIITLQYHNVPPIYLDFVIKVRIVKYTVGKSEREMREEVFKAIRKYFDEIEIFDSSIFESNLIKYIDREFNNETGIELKIFLETSIEKRDFSQTGYAEEETSSKTYSAEFLFQFPINGIFTDNVYSYNGDIIEVGKLIKERLPNLVSSSFIEKGDKLYFDFDHITYFKNISGVNTEIKDGKVEDINSLVKQFYVPLMLDTRAISPGSSYPKKIQQIGNLKVYPETKLIYVEINATESKNNKDLEKRLSLDIFDEIKTFSVEIDSNMVLKRNTFPRLKKVEIVEEIE